MEPAHAFRPDASRHLGPTDPSAGPGPLNDPRERTVVELVSSYVTGERTETDVREAALADPAVAPLAARGLGCNGLAQDLLEAVGMSPFDADSPIAAATPSRDGLLRWLHRVRDGETGPEALCDWAADVFGWHDPAHPMDPVVQEILGGIAGAEDDVLALVHDDARFELARWQLEHTPADRAATVAVGRVVLDRRDELLVALVSRIEGATDDDGLRAALSSALAELRATEPDLIERMVEATAALAGDRADLDRVERYLVGLARHGDPIAALAPDAGA